MIYPFEVFKRVGNVAYRLKQPEIRSEWRKTEAGVPQSSLVGHPGHTRAKCEFIAEFGVVQIKKSSRYAD
jgi:hypothetical protein